MNSKTTYRDGAWEADRVARKDYRCCGCGQRILVGEKHRRYTAHPAHDANTTGHFWTLRECARCAAARDQMRAGDEP